MSSSAPCLAKLPLLLLLLLPLLFQATPTGASVNASGAQRTLCLRNCHLCQQMYGDHFEGHLCAHTCIKLKGRLIPDCTNFASIAPYLDLSNMV